MSSSLICTIDVKGQIPCPVKINYRQPDRLQPIGRCLRTGHDAVDLAFDPHQRINKEIGRRPGSDTDDIARFNKIECSLRREALLLILAHG